MSQESLVWDHPNNNIQDDEQQFREELIQRATTRLRRRLLEQGLQDFVSQVVSIQTQLESLRLDATTTIATISNIFDKTKENGDETMNRQMDVLERRLATHRSSLDQLVVPTTTEEEQDDINSTKSDDLIPNSPTALTMSRLSSLSLMSSFFSGSRSGTNSTATSISDQYSLKHDSSSSLMDDDCISQIENIRGGDPFYDLSGKRSFKEGSFCGSVYHEQLQQELPAPVTNLSEIRWRRRQRRQRHQKHLEKQQFYSDDESLVSDDLSSLSSSVSQYDHHHQNNILHLNHTATTTTTTLPCHPLSTTPNYRHHPADNNYFTEKQLNVNDLTQSWLSCTEFIQQQQYQLQQENTCIYPQRNVLDEAMSFLDGLGENADDGGFGEDMYLLLGNPDLCCRPLSEVETTIQELRQQRQLNYFNPTTWCQLGKNVVYNTTCTSLQWCRFLSVLSAAVVISIMNGPEDVVRHSTI